MAAPAATLTLTATEIAGAVGGAVLGDGGVRVSAIAPLDRAGPDDLSFLASPKYCAAFEASRAGVVLVAPELRESPGATRARVIVERPHEALVALLPKFYRPATFAPGVHPSAVVDASAQVASDARVDARAVIGAGAIVGARAWIGPGAVVGDGVRIGSDTRLFANVTVYPGSAIGDRSAIHAGATIGSDGFGYAFRDGAHRKIPHVGRCVIGNDVEIGANCGIDRGSIDDTVIGDGTKIDNLVHVAHNVRIGRLCLIMAQVGIAGSARVEDGAIIAGQVGVGGHNTIGKGATIGGQAGVFGDVPPGETWSGYPARPHRESLRASAAVTRLVGIIKQLERLVGGGGK